MGPYMVLLGGSDLTDAISAWLVGFFLFPLASLTFAGSLITPFSGHLGLCVPWFSWALSGSGFLGAPVSFSGLVSDSV